MSKCHVPRCRSRKFLKSFDESRITFHRFPTNKLLRRKWLNFFGYKCSFDTRNIFVCSLHFSPDSFGDTVLTYNQQRRRLRTGAIPCIRSLDLPKRSATIRSVSNVTEESGEAATGNHSDYSHCQFLHGYSNDCLESTAVGEQVNGSGFVASVSGSELEHLSGTKEQNERSLSANEITTVAKYGILCHKRERELRATIEELQSKLENQDHQISNLKKQTFELQRRIHEQVKAFDDLKKVHKEEVINKARGLLAQIFTANQINLMTGIKADLDDASQRSS
ncbi:uncharacterized protein LOC129766619 [Toxorhynchites rutilus septentrionalis]|uniref:uncharacterized protein LOC129766619 n=1 Tax=Toxorhynchites rutilus septentrionalis TaxID=329112 RepID=UPI002479A4CB|nr:uncharacterized protein LOC129766619 [Toxorhynchites rutilus septentrionalis]